MNSVHGRYPQILGSLFVNDNNLVALDIFVQNISQSMFFTGITNIFKTSCEHQFYSFEIQFFHKQRPTLTLMLPNLQQDYTLKCLHKIIYHIWKNKSFFWFFLYIIDDVTCLCDLYTHVTKKMLEQQHKPWNGPCHGKSSFIYSSIAILSSITKILHNLEFKWKLENLLNK